MQKVSLYIRHSSSRKYEKLTDKKTFAGGNFPAGTIFVLRYVRDGKRVFETLKDCPNLKKAFEHKLTREIQLLRGTVAVPAPRPAPTPKPVAQTPTAPSSGTLMLDAAIDRYKENVALKSSKTSNGYGYSLQQFYRSVGRNKPLTEVAKQDLYDFIAYLRREGLSDRTIHNRVGEIVTFLRHFGIKDVTLRVKYTEKKVRAYRPDELKALFAAATPDEWLLFQFFLCTGVREQEAMNAEWNDIDFVDSLFTVKAKPGWTPKDYEEREIPIPDFLVAALKKRLLESKGKLIFPTKAGKREGHMLRKLQYLAKRAGLLGEFGLHKFRKTWATLQHRAGVDARTIQKRLGHSDLATTLAYLEGEDARSERSRDQVNNTFGVFAEV
jgi:integrase/recombinase XerD